MFFCTSIRENLCHLLTLSKSRQAHPWQFYIFRLFHIHTHKNTKYRKLSNYVTPKRAPYVLEHLETFGLHQNWPWQITEASKISSFSFLS